MPLAFTKSNNMKVVMSSSCRLVSIIEKTNELIMLVMSGSRIFNMKKRTLKHRIEEVKENLMVQN